MSELIENKIVQMILGVIVILIWGYNMLKITDIATPASSGNQSPFTALDQDLLEIPDLLQYDYKADFRDPFLPGLTQQTSLPVANNIESNPPPPPVTPPDVKLTGVIEGTALLQNSRNELFFAAPGDTVDGALVKSVTPYSVVMIFKSKEFTVTLNN
ncbi:MAG: hypothetical protein ACFCU6_09775 [Balneolaceae bacterium]